MIVFFFISPDRAFSGIIVIEPFPAGGTRDGFDSSNHTNPFTFNALEFSLYLSYNNHAEKHNENPGSGRQNLTPGVLAFF